MLSCKKKRTKPDEPDYYLANVQEQPGQKIEGQGDHPDYPKDPDCQSWLSFALVLLFCISAAAVLWCVALTVEVSSLSSRMVDASTDESDDVDDLQAQLNNLYANITTLSSQLDQLTSKVIPAMQAEIEGLRMHLGQVSNDTIPEMQTSIAVINVELEHLTKETIPSLQEEIFVINNATIPDIQEEMFLISAVLYDTISQVRSLSNYDCTLECAFDSMPLADCSGCAPCPQGYGGATCDEPTGTCDLVCYHGGSPNDACDSCTCWGMYAPPDCLEFYANATSENIYDMFMAAGSTLLAPTTAREESDGCPVSEQLNLIGLPINIKNDLVEGSVQVISNTFNDGTILQDAYGTDHCIPDGVQARLGTMEGLEPTRNQLLLSTPEDFVDLAKRLLTSSSRTVSYVSTLTNLTPEEVVDTLFGGTRVFAESMDYELIYMQYPPALGSYVNLPLTPGFRLLVSLMPPLESPFSQAAWNALFDMVVGVTTTSSIGGRAELIDQLLVCITQYMSTEALNEELGKYTSSTLGMGQPAGGISATVVDATVDQKLMVIGGDVSLALDPNPTNFAAWVDSITDHLSVYSFTSVWICSIIPDAQHRSDCNVVLKNYRIAAAESRANFIGEVSALIESDRTQPREFSAVAHYQNYNVCGHSDNDDVGDVTNSMVQTSVTLTPGAGFVAVDMPGICSALQYQVQLDSSGMYLQTAVMVKGNINCWCYGDTTDTEWYYSDWQPADKCVSSSMPTTMHNVNSESKHPGTVFSTFTVCGCAVKVSPSFGVACAC